MANIRPYNGLDEQKLMTEIWDPQIADNPEKFVLFAFPWGKRNTPLENFKGPRTWQRDELQSVTQFIADNKNRKRAGLPPLMYQSATGSGRGVGKSSLTSWLNLWMLSTRIGSTCINTANTEAQLKTRTWAELGKWHTLAINSHWFEKGTMTLKPEPWFEKALKNQLKIDTGYFYSQAQIWNEENPDAFAGVHNLYGVLVIFDEASGIPKPIWTVTEGFFTDPTPDRFWFAFSNCRRNTGSFFECFHKNRKFWLRRNLDSRKVEDTDLNKLNQIIEQHGEDSDEARVEVKGEFPRQGDKQFISRGLIDEAVAREIVDDPWAPLVLGIDPARYGDDSTTFVFRQGRNARIIPLEKMDKMDNMEVANRAAFLINKYNPDGVFIDAGNGTGVIDRLRELGFIIHEVWFGGKSPEKAYLNMRTYIWAQVRDWLGGGCLPDCVDLIDDLAAPEYKFVKSSDVIRLETKEELKARGFASPDHGDGLACTFAAKVARKDIRRSRNNPVARNRVARDVDYDVFS